MKMGRDNQTGILEVEGYALSPYPAHLSLVVIAIAASKDPLNIKQGLEDCIYKQNNAEIM